MGHRGPHSLTVPQGETLTTKVQIGINAVVVDSKHCEEGGPSEEATAEAEAA